MNKKKKKICQLQTVHVEDSSTVPTHLSSLFKNNHKKKPIVNSPSNFEITPRNRSLKKLVATCSSASSMRLDPWPIAVPKNTKRSTYADGPLHGVNVALSMNTPFGNARVTRQPRSTPLFSRHHDRRSARSTVGPVPAVRLQWGVGGNGAEGGNGFRTPAPLCACFVCASVCACVFSIRFRVRAR